MGPFAGTIIKGDSLGNTLLVLLNGLCDIRKRGLLFSLNSATPVQLSAIQVL